MTNQRVVAVIFLFLGLLAQPLTAQTINTFEGMDASQLARPEFDVDPNEWRKQFWSEDASANAGAKADAKQKPNGADHWDPPDMGILRMRRRPPPVLPLEVFGARLETMDHRHG